MQTRALLRGTAVCCLASAAQAASTHYKEDTCDLVGDGDLYGIGIRIGYYLAFFASVISLLFRNYRGVMSALKALTIVHLILLLVAVRNAANGGVTLLEWTITNALFVGLSSPVFFGLMSYDASESAGLNESALVTLGIYLLGFCTYLGLQPWVAWKLVDQGRRLDCPPLKMWIFASFDLHNATFVRFLKAASVISCIGAPTFLIAGVIMIAVGIVGVNSPSWTRIKELSKELAGASDPEDRPQISAYSITMAAIFAAFGALNIAVVEEVILKNDVDLSKTSFTSTGQLIAFVVGLIALLRTITVIFAPTGNRSELPPPLADEDQVGMEQPHPEPATREKLTPR